MLFRSINVRVKGGAYGCMCDFNHLGNCYFVSYRDPNLSETYDIYRKAVEYVENFDASDRDMTKYIIGTMSNVDMPFTPYDLGRVSFARYLSKISDELRQKTRDEMLSANQEAIRKLAPFLKLLADSDVICTVGGEEKINEEANLFKTVDKLI